MIRSRREVERTTPVVKNTYDAARMLVPLTGCGS
jgi:hypothetical protein